MFRDDKMQRSKVTDKLIGLSKTEACVDGAIANLQFDKVDLLTCRTINMYNGQPQIVCVVMSPFNSYYVSMSTCS